MNNLPEASAGTPGTRRRARLGYGWLLAFHRPPTVEFWPERSAPATRTGAIGAGHGDAHGWADVVLVGRNERRVTRCAP